MVLEQAQCFSHTGAGMLLDQEKAYDRVNAVYLGAVLERFGFPDRFVSCINQLFFGNAMFVNINGFFTAGVHQERGIRQGDPLSPLLFDLALEPFLLSILQDPQFCGFNVTDGCVPPPLVNSVAVPTIKCLAYADDVCVLLRDPSDLARLQAHMDRYAAVSNAKFNKDKSEAFALDGRHSPSWQAAFEDMNLQVYHHQGSGSAFRYLGLYFAYNHTQRAQIEEMLLSSPNSIQDLVLPPSTAANQTFPRECQNMHLPVRMEQEISITTEREGVPASSFGGAICSRSIHPTVGLAKAMVELPG
ncbi:hypothetical protein [Parasitella parasitica]|uniref:Reverse transcriptase domain-containing protein n=1 Tax=Parasitella parasitica TaxID=35722 RepID=A0A0B7MSC8_9FUNG|nr:hypothetical protein [Parasitella parasitica]